MAKITPLQFVRSVHVPRRTSFPVGPFVPRWRGAIMSSARDIEAWNLCFDFTLTNAPHVSGGHEPTAETRPIVPRVQQMSISEVCITTDPNNPAEVTTHARRRAGTHLSTSPALQEPSVDRTDIAIDPPEPSPDVIINRAENRNVHHAEKPPTVGANVPSISADNGQSPGFAVNTVSATERKYMGSTSLQVFSQWLDMTFHVLPAGLTSSFQHGMRFCEEMDLPEDLHMPPIPAEWHKYINAFFTGVGKVFPIVSKETINSCAQYMCQQDPRSLPSRQRPLIASVYACLAVGADSLGSTAQGLDYATAAYSLYAYLVARPYLQSAQALLLICLALRGRNKDGAGSQALGQAIRILHTLGLHRRLSGYGSLNGEQTEAVRLGVYTWWSAYCLDRIMSLESGRPPLVQDEDIDQVRVLQPSGVQDLEPLQALLDLGTIQGSICRHLATIKLPTIAAVLDAQSRLDQSLLKWQGALPHDLRCDGDITINGMNLAVPRAFLAIQFHTTMINLHRAALLMDKDIHQTNLARYNLSSNRLASSESICANSSRAIITAFLQVRDITRHSRLQTMTGPLMAIYVLSINTLKNPTSWSARSDVGLIYSAAEAVEQVYTADGQDPAFYTLLKTLKQLASQDTLSPKGLTNSRAPTRRTSPQTNQSRTGPSSESINRGYEMNGVQLNHMLDHNLSDEWDTLFPRLYVGDFALDAEAFEGMDIEHLMGIPHLAFDEPH
ncbi:hypothetical protein E4T38_03135 [Aureobasidium subglaciale]|nr:hypothetical protein E4T38_03135 [Aureobasidium subglaciale]KAI5226829.1 hypothetical protein E4T40_02909 [Aureobasidium subglaciale]KAI5230154.1 hypothetical protein E4T41_03132 [Aureobasidium subglaciale]KAI5264561.1 hypothetical protein E4T46_02910 [Aureobasidium subglaciale]